MLFSGVSPQVRLSVVARDRDAGNNLLNHHFLRGASQTLLFTKNEAVGKDRDGEVLDVIRQDEVPAAQCSQGLTRAHEAERTPWACSKTEATVGPCCGNDSGNKLLNQLRDVDLLAGRLKVTNSFGLVTGVSA